MALSDVVERLVCSPPQPCRRRKLPTGLRGKRCFFSFNRRSALVHGIPWRRWWLCPRVYCGVHYPADVTAGGDPWRGAGYAICLTLACNLRWNFIGRKFFPCGINDCHPSSIARLRPRPETKSAAVIAPAGETEWLRWVMSSSSWRCWPAGHIASGLIGLSGDEAYQWLWSKHLALAYFSKPPASAFLQWAGTHIAGDSELGVRLFSTGDSWPA